MRRDGTAGALKIGCSHHSPPISRLPRGWMLAARRTWIGHVWRERNILAGRRCRLQAAEQLGVSRSRVYELLGTGDLPSFAIGRRRLIAVAELAASVARLSEHRP